MRRRAWKIAAWGAAVLAVGAGGCVAGWWIGWVSVPGGIVSAVIERSLLKAGFTHAEVEVVRFTGKEIEIGATSLSHAGADFGWKSLSVREPLARYRGGQMEIVLRKPWATVEFGAEPSPAQAEDAANAPSRALQEVLVWEPGNVRVHGGEVFFIRGEKRQRWELDADVRFPDASRGGPIVATLGATGADDRSVRLEVKGRVQPASAEIIADVELTSPTLVPIVELAGFWDARVNAAAVGVAAEALRITGTLSYGLDGFRAREVRVGGSSLGRSDARTNVQCGTWMLAMPAGKVWTGGMPEAEFRTGAVKAETGDWQVSMADVRLRAATGSVELAHGAVTAKGARAEILLRGGRWTHPGMPLSETTPFAGGTLELADGRANGLGWSLHWTRVAGAGSGNALPLEIAGADALADSGEWRVELPLLRAAWEQAERRMTVEGAGWAERSTRATDSSIELAEVPVSLRAVAETGGEPRVSVVLEQPETEWSTGAGEARLGWSGGLRAVAVADREGLLADVAAAGRTLAAGTGAVALSAQTLGVQASGLTLRWEDAERLGKFFAGRGAVPAPGSVDGCIALKADGVAARKAGETLAERLRLSGSARIRELDTNRGWEVAVEAGRASAGPIGLNRIGARITGGLAGGRAEGTVYVRGTDIPVKFEQTFSWGEEAGARGVVRIDDAPLGDVEPWLPLAPQLKGWDFGGRVDAEVRTRAGSEGVRAEGTVHLAQTRLKAPGGTVAVSDFDGTFGIDVGGEVVSVKSIGEMTARQIASGTMGVENLRGRLALEGSRLRVEGVRAGGFGGQVFLKDTEFDLSSGALNTAVVLDNVALDLVLASFPDLPMRGEGRVFGEVPLRMSPESFRIGASVLRAGENGVIRLSIPELALAEGERPPWWQFAARAKWDVMLRTQTAMRTVEVRDVSVEFDPPSEPGTGVLIKANGGFSNEEVKAKVDVVARIRGELAEIFRIGAAVAGIGSEK